MTLQTNGQHTANALGIQFMGQMTASISHEIKNSLAIINENAGLLADLALLMEKGRPLPPERLQIVAGKIGKQVQRADGIVRRLNQFAHSAEGDVQEYDLHQLLLEIKALFDRVATMKGVELVVLGDSMVQAKLRPFILENVLWLLVQQCFLLDPLPGRLAMQAVQVGASVEICLTPETSSSLVPVVAGFSQIGHSLLVSLPARLTFQPEQSIIILTLEEGCCG